MRYSVCVEQHESKPPKTTSAGHLRALLERLAEQQKPNAQAALKRMDVVAAKPLRAVNALLRRLQKK